VLSRTSTLDHYVSTADDLETAAVAILDKEIAASGRLCLRLMGVRLSFLRSISSASEQGADAQPLHHAGPLDRFLGSARDGGRRHTPNAADEAHAAVAEREEAASARGWGMHGGGATDGAFGEREDVVDVMRCPVCDGVLAPDTDANQHLDACLSKQAIRDLVGQSHRDVLHSAARGADEDNGRGGGGKRRKTKGKTPTGPLDAFLVASTSAKKKQF
jgi:hypothetical protein